MPLEAVSKIVGGSRCAMKPWEDAPHQLISWWDMQRFSAGAFYRIGKLLEELRHVWSQPVGVGDAAYSFVKRPDPFVQEGDATALANLLALIRENCDSVGLNLSVRAIDSLSQTLQQPNAITYKQVPSRIEELDRRIQDEMRNHLFMFIPPKDAEKYDKAELFGVAVNTKFPKAQFDIIEAGNCYAAGRGTAAVFHLMRVMETAVQAFGSVLGISLVNEKNWQVILNEIHKAIKTLPAKDQRTIELSEAAANLYSVKLAWRNPVMHPKEIYTQEEAKKILDATQNFMEHLARVI